MNRYPSYKGVVRIHKFLAQDFSKIYGFTDFVADGYRRNESSVGTGPPGTFPAPLTLPRSVGELVVVNETDSDFAFSNVSMFHHWLTLSIACRIPLWAARHPPLVSRGLAMASIEETD
jgi:hypothetical protein